MASNLFSAVLNGSPVSAATSAAKRASKPAFVLSPVPTAVPPWASALSLGSAARTRSMPYSTCVA